MVLQVATSVAAPHVVVLDPRFDDYGDLVESARAGRLRLHMRTSGESGLEFAKKQPVDAWLVAAELDDMSGLDFVELLRSQLETSKSTDSEGGEQRVAIVSDVPGTPGPLERFAPPSRRGNNNTEKWKNG